MSVYLDDGDVVLHLGDCVEVMAAMPAESVDAVVTDPPYGLGTEPDIAEVLRHWLNGDDYQHRGGGFMGRTWDSFVPGPAVWREVYRVLKPGGHLLAFSGTRTSDLQTIVLRLAGFQVRDSVVWLYGSGFPKSLDVSKAIDKAAGAEREVVGEERSPFRMADPFMGNSLQSTQSGDTRRTDAEGYIVREVTAPATPEAQAWQGWGTALKPAHEPVVVARKPLRERTVAGQVLATGTGALNIDGCRIASPDAPAEPSVALNAGPRYRGVLNGGTTSADEPRTTSTTTAGRWPANVTLDQAAADQIDAEVGDLGPTPRPYVRSVQAQGMYGAARPADEVQSGFGDRGGPSRFFYTAKASTAERDGATHPTVKPLDLMRWLVRLVTPPGGTILEPFAGSGTTLLAARNEGFRSIGIEREEDYCAMAAHRLRQLSIFGAGEAA